jgi:MYXO-CTERM domain-containing protein
MAWRIQATYRFVNPTSERVALQMGFPEVRCDAGEGDCVGRGGEFRNMRTTVRGDVIRHRFGEVTRHPEWPELGRVFLYDVEFAPNETVEIVHRYVHDRTFVAAGFVEELHYLTRTGASWNGPIGEAEFIVRVPYVPRGVVAHRDYPLERRLIRDSGVPRGVSLRALVRDLRPTNDFTVLFAGIDGFGPPQLTAANCPMIEDVVEAMPEEVTLELARVPTDALQICAAALETQYGADVGPELTAVLDRARTSSDVLDMFMEGVVVVPPHSLPDYTPEWLPPPERAYVERLKAEAARRPPEPVAPAEATPEPTASTEPPPVVAPPTAPPAASSRGCGGCTVVPAGHSGLETGLLSVALFFGFRRRRRDRRSTA